MHSNTFPSHYFPIAYVDSLHMTDGMIGLGTAIFYGAMMLASFRLGYYSTRYGHRKVLVVSAALFPIFPLFLGMAKGPELYYLACLTGGGDQRHAQWCHHQSPDGPCAIPMTVRHTWHSITWRLTWAFWLALYWGQSQQT